MRAAAASRRMCRRRRAEAGGEAWSWGSYSDQGGMGSQANEERISLSLLGWFRFQSASLVFPSGEAPSRSAVDTRPHLTADDASRCLRAAADLRKGGGRMNLCEDRADIAFCVRERSIRIDRDKVVLEGGAKRILDAVQSPGAHLSGADAFLKNGFPGLSLQLQVLLI